MTLIQTLSLLARPHRTNVMAQGKTCPLSVDNETPSFIRFSLFATHFVKRRRWNQRKSPVRFPERMRAVVTRIKLVWQTRVSGVTSVENKHL